MSVRGFTPANASPEPGATLELDDEESRYLVKVRRVAIGDAIELFDGRGGAWAACVRTLGRRARVEIGPALALTEPPARILLLGLPDAPATLEALTGASELGATEVVFVRCARSQGRVPPVDRIARVLRASQRQCGRPRPIELVGADAPLELDRALAHRSELPGWFAWEGLRDRAAAEPDREPLGLRLLVGPEGGLTPSEVETIGAAGLRPIGLGPWVLRTPTAAVALLARFVRVT